MVIERPLFPNATVHRLSARLIEVLKQDVRLSLRELTTQHKQVDYVDCHLGVQLELSSL